MPVNSASLEEIDFDGKPKERLQHEAQPREEIRLDTDSILLNNVQEKPCDCGGEPVSETLQNIVDIYRKNSQVNENDLETVLGIVTTVVPGTQVTLEDSEVVILYDSEFWCRTSLTQYLKQLELH